MLRCEMDGKNARFPFFFLLPDGTVQPACVRRRKGQVGVCGVDNDRQE